MIYSILTVAGTPDDQAAGAADVDAELSSLRLLATQTVTFLYLAIWYEAGSAVTEENGSMKNGIGDGVCETLENQMSSDEPGSGDP